MGHGLSSVKAQEWYEYKTGCHLNNWAVKGCGEGEVEINREACTERGFPGYYYTCRGGNQVGSLDGGGSRSVATGRKTGVEGDKKEFNITYEQFSKAVTSCKYPSRLPKPSMEQYKYFVRYGKKWGKIATNEEAAMALAQLLHESDGLQTKREYPSPKTGRRNNYIVQGKGVPGENYYGRGYIQLTWWYNYESASQAIFGDDRLLKNPDLVASSEETAWKAAFWYWSDRVRDKPGVQQGQFGASTNAINGKIECSSPGNEKAQARFQIYGRVRKAFGLTGAGDPSGCY